MVRPTREMRSRPILSLGLGSTLGGGGGGPGGTGQAPWDYVVAADDTAADLQTIANAQCDGTDDEVEINGAITASVTAGRPYSILLLPGTYVLGDAIDFTGLTASGADWLMFEASGTTIIAGANLTTMIDLAPGPGGQIITCADLRFGAIDGADGTFTVTQLVNMARFNDNILRIADLRNGSGNGITVAQNGVSDYPCGNNRIDVEIIHNFDGKALHATGSVGSAFGFQGNTVHIGEIIACDYGIVMGENVDENATYNTFITGPIEHNDTVGILDFCGGNTYIVGNMNTNGEEIDCPSGMDLRSTFVLHMDEGSNGGIDADVLAQHYVMVNGELRGRAFMAEKASTPSTPASGFGEFYPKSDGKPYFLNDAGTETDLTAGGAPSGAAGGDLSGTYPNPSVVDDSHDHTSATISGLSNLLTVDPGTVTYDDTGPDVIVEVASVWGYDGDGPYYDDAGVVTGEEAILALDPSTGEFAVVPYNP